MKPILRMIAALVLTALPAGAESFQTPVRGAPPAPGKAVWFGIHFIDTSTEGAINGIRADETARIEMAEDYIAADLTERGFELSEPAPDAVAAIRNPVHSNGRDTKIAHEMGADYAISAEVQKVSNLILAMNLYIRDAETGQTLRAGAVDIRGNNDESWQRGYRYLLQNIIFREK